MTPIRIYLYANCSSCRNADAILASYGKAVVRRDILTGKLDTTEMSRLLNETGNTPQEMLSMRSTAFRQPGLADRTVSVAELIDSMSEHSCLLNRPIIISGNEILVGFKRTAVEATGASYVEG